ncbi:acetate--CoA ligase [Pendulispora brunnea]|uniref:Acetyl-coenzyme A synthetase n=1 Tax=Pendulispora brunnea TaxID=2905690 RepID=A0ABZ2K1Z1_9BACT
MTDGIESRLREERKFVPSAEFSAHARVQSHAEYVSLYTQSIESPEEFWRDQTCDLVFRTRPTSFLEWNLPKAKFFGGATLNITESCLDRHLKTSARTRAAIVWEGEPGDTRTLTYFELHREVVRLSTQLASLGVRAGDRVAIYMGMVPETAIAMLACARLGATHSVIFGGFSSDALRDRINDCGAKLLLTQDGAWRRGSIVPLKQMADVAVAQTPTIEKVVVLRRIGAEKAPVTMKEGRDVWWDDLLAREAAPEHRAIAEKPAAFDAEHPLFVLYTSGSTGKPKGVLHTTAGYLAGVHVSSKYVFDLREGDLYWCTADVGWVTGHSYIVYGPLSCGASCLMYEGAPNFPDPGRFWKIIERHGVTILYTAPTAIRAFIRWGDDWPNKADLSSLRLLGSVGEPINPEAWTWYHRVIGGGRCPIVDTWWQTETGAIMLTTLPGACYSKPGSTGLPFFGVDIAVVKDRGEPCGTNEGGKLVVKSPWPSMARTLYNDDERYVSAYWKQIEGVYFTGDGARKDEDGYFWVVGRIDDVLNVAGHRIGTAEIESALVSHPFVAEAAAVGKPDELKGQALVVFVTLKQGQTANDETKANLSKHIEKEIGKFARPDSIRFADALPKTRSGKIMRRLLKEVASGATEAKGDTSTLEDLGVLAKLRADED